MGITRVLPRSRSQVQVRHPRKRMLKRRMRKLWRKLKTMPKCPKKVGMRRKKPKPSKQGGLYGLRSLGAQRVLSDIHVQEATFFCCFSSKLWALVVMHGADVVLICRTS